MGQHAAVLQLRPPTSYVLGSFSGQARIFATHFLFKISNDPG